MLKKKPFTAPSPGANRALVVSTTLHRSAAHEGARAWLRPLHAGCGNTSRSSPELGSLLTPASLDKAACVAHSQRAKSDANPAPSAYARPTARRSGARARCVFGFTAIATGLCSAGCAGPTRLRHGCAPEQLRLGLYEVVDRSCELPARRTRDCPLTTYVELRAGADFRMQAPYVFVEWFAEKPGASDYAYEVEPLLGHCTQAGRYMLEQSEQGDAWLSLDGDIPVEYACDAYVTDEHRELLFRARFQLRPVTRTPELERLLRVE